MSESPAVPSTSNSRKYQSRNPIQQTLIRRFFDETIEAAEVGPHDRILDVGCGEGQLRRRLAEGSFRSYTGADLHDESVAYCREAFPSSGFIAASAYRLPFSAGSFERCFCLEVLEHLEAPDAALAELLRVTADRLIVSVPHEPYFIACNFLRGKYLRRLGNHPEHINHWTAQSFERFLQTRCADVHVRRSFPWLIGVCRQ